MKAFINNKEISIESNVSLKKIIEDNNIKNFVGLAIAVNNNIIPRKDWDNYLLNDGDKIIVIEATCGG